MHLKTLESQDVFSSEELGHLLLALGFPRDLFSKNLSKDMYTGGSGLLTKTLIKCCDLHYFNKDLHFTVNLKSGSYNNEILRKSVALLSQMFFSFSDLQSVRLAFETYEEYDQKGMSLRERTLLRTLKLCNRVISPQKLMNKLRHIQSSFKEKGRIQFYEFLDLLWWCEQVNPDEIESDKSSVLKKTWREVYCVENFKKFVLPKDKRLWKELNEKYQQEELRHGHPTLESKAFVDLPVKAEEFKTQVRLSNKDYLNIQKKLRDSDKQIKLAKGGSSQSRPRPKTSLSASTSKSKFAKSSTSATSLCGIAWTNRATSYQSPSTITAVPTFRSMPVEDTKPEPPKLEARAASCPPAVNSQSRDEIARQIDQLKFEMHTKDQRWAEALRSEISQYMSNYDEVLERVRRPPPAPCKRRHYRPKQPPDSTMRRLAQPKPVMPGRHVSHCDAITMGMGSDDHAVAIQKHGRKHSPRGFADEKQTKRKRKKSKPKWNSLSHRNASLLERLLDDMDKESVTAPDNTPAMNDFKPIPHIEQPNDIVEVMTQVDDLEILENKLPVEEVTSQDRCSETPPRFVYIHKPRDRESEALKAMDGEFSRIFLDPSDGVKQDQEFASLPRDCTFDRFSRPPSGRSVDSQTTEITEFEKFIGDPENLRIPDDRFLGNTTKSSAYLRKRRTSLARIAGRFEGEQRSNARGVSKTTKSSRKLTK